MTTIQLLGAAAVPSIVGIVEAMKSAGLPARWAPIAAIILGTAAALCTALQASYPWLQAVPIGAGIGLAAVGLHGGLSNTVHYNSNPQTTTAPNGGGSPVVRRAPKRRSRGVPEPSAPKVEIPATKILWQHDHPPDAGDQEDAADGS
jgi:hypothetical protein